MRAFVRWLIRVKDNNAVKDMFEDGECMLDYGALAKSLEVPKNMYCHYTLSFHRDENCNSKSDCLTSFWRIELKCHDLHCICSAIGRARGSEMI